MLNERLPYAPAPPISQGPRDIVEEYWVELLDENENVLRILDEFVDGEVSWTQGRTDFGAASLACAFRADSHINPHPDPEAHPNFSWGKARVRIWYTVGGVSAPLGTFLTALPELTYNSDQRQVYGEIQCSDKIQILSQDFFGDAITVPAGSNPILVANWVIASAGVPLDQIWNEPEALAVVEPTVEDRTWGMSYSKREIVNDLLRDAGMGRLRTNAMGVFLIQRRETPEWSNPVTTFGQDWWTLRSPEWARTFNWFNTPNVIALHARPHLAYNTPNPDHPGVRMVWVNDDPEHPFSIPRRGRRIVHVEEDINVSSEWGLLGMMLVRARDNLLPIANIHVAYSPSHARNVVDGVMFARMVQILDTVEFISHEGATPRVAHVYSWSLELRPGSMIEATWRELMTTLPAWRQIEPLCWSFNASLRVPGPSGDPIPRCS